ncbi:MAG: PfkB family carbohydrate kinase, partial [Sciscionella sp.]
PNLDEIRLLTGIEVLAAGQQRDAAVALHEFGPEWVLVKGGHLTEDADCVDLLYDGHQFTELSGPRVATPHTHGGGDTIAAAITSALARGMTMPEAVRYGKRFISRAVAHGYPLGAGIGPVSPFWRLPPDDL